jgi:hypothetical protein
MLSDICRVASVWLEPSRNDHSFGERRRVKSSSREKESGSKKKRSAGQYVVL